MIKNFEIKYRKATKKDAKIIFDWANEIAVREASFYSDPINWESHIDWFNKKLIDENSLILIFFYRGKPASIVRIEKTTEAIIGISIDAEFRGKKIAPLILKIACAEFWKIVNVPLYAYIKKDNISSVKSFEKAGFFFQRNDCINGNDCFVYIKKKEQ